MKYIGFRWWHLLFIKKNFDKLKISSFDLIIDCQSKLRNTIILKQLPTKYFYSSTFNYFFCKNKKSKIVKNSISKHITEKIIFDLNNIFSLNLKNIKIDIKNIPELFLNEAKK